jgi:hypothetical protein
LTAVLVTARRLVPVAAGLLLAAAAACAAPAERATALPPAAPAPAVAATSAAGDPGERAAARDVVRRYFAVVNRLPVVMDADGLERLMSARCTCREQARSVRRAAALGERYVDVTTDLTLVPAVDSPSSASVLAVYDATAGGLVDRDGRPLDHSPAQRRIKRLFRVVRVGDQWLINEIEAA